MNIKAQVLTNIYSPNKCWTSALVQNGFISGQIQAQQKQSGYKVYVQFNCTVTLSKCNWQMNLHIVNWALNGNQIRYI